MIKKTLLIFFFFIMNNSYSYAGYGSGDLNISGNALNWFIQYIQNPGGKKNPGGSPMKFSVSNDGKQAWYYYCNAMTHTQCGSISDKELNKKCEQKSFGSKCQVFAVGRNIRWRNGTAEIKRLKFKKSDTRQEIIAKLTDLNFIKKEEKKTEPDKKMKSSKKDLSTQLIEITDLYKSGALSEEEYLKAKNKLLGQ